MRLANGNQIFYWMMRHRSLWETWPHTKPDHEAWLQWCFGNRPRPDGPLPEEIEAVTDDIRKKCVAGLQQAGLVSKRTGWRDVAIDRHIIRVRNLYA